MKELLWGLYEAERESGSKELAEKIGDAYTVLDQIDMDNIDEGFALQTYYGLSKLITKDMIHGNATAGVQAYRILEQAMVEAGLLEADEEEAEEEETDDDRNSAEHWDEWMADQRYDAYRDFDIAMGYER